MVVLLIAVLSVMDAAQADEAPFKVRLVNDIDGPVYELGGYIDFGSSVTFLNLIGKKGGNGWLILNSTGGSTMDAIFIGRAVRRYNMKTIVPKGAVCLSSCAIIWSGGVEKWSEGTNTIAFHRPWHLKTLKDADQTMIRAYYRDMGYSSEATEKFLAPARTFFYLDAKKAQQLKIDVHFTE